MTSEPTTVRLIAKQDATIACTLDAGAMPQRLADWRSLLAHATGRDAIDGGVRVRFPGGAELAAEITELAAAEQACCSFFDFTIHIEGSSVALDVRAPVDAADLVTSLFGAPTN